MPNGHDQFDNGWRIEQLRLGRSLPQTRYRAAAVAPLIRSLLDDPLLAARARAYAARINARSAVTRACELIEALEA